VVTLPEYEQIARFSRPDVEPYSPNLPVVEEDSAEGEVAALYDHFRTHFGRPDVPGILKCFATHPPLLRQMMDLSESMIFSDGHLTRRHKEMIATLVSSQNQCAYCADSHGFFLRMRGGSAEVLCAIQQSDLDSSALTAAERTLLAFAQKVNQDSHKVAPADIEALIQAGWSNAQIAEAIHVTALFATFNRVVNAFGLRSQGLLGLYESSAQRDGLDTAGSAL
jgi:uncharacterized peroxidase-related enzyme